MKGRMKVAMLHKPSDMRIEDVEIPQTGPHEVLVQMKRVGICGSDVHYYLEGRISNRVVEEPMILGHECAGQIVEVGEKVSNAEVGQRVVIEPGFTCGKCDFCRNGRYNLCRDILFYGAPPYDGAFAEYVTAPEQNIILIPDNLSYEEGAMIEPLAVGMMAAKKGKVSVNDVVAVMGAGPIGQMSLQSTRVYGALETIVTDLIDYRLDYAKKYGASAVVNAAEENVTERMLELTDGQGVDVIIDASGSSSAILQALDFSKPGGRIVLVGFPTVDVPVPFAKVIAKELSITGLFRYTNVFQAAVNAVSSGKAVVKPYVTRLFPLEQIEAGFKAHSNRIGNPMKIQIAM